MFAALVRPVTVTTGFYSATRWLHSSSPGGRGRSLRVHAATVVIPMATTSGLSDMASLRFVYGPLNSGAAGCRTVVT